MLAALAACGGRRRRRRRRRGRHRSSSTPTTIRAAAASLVVAQRDDRGHPPSVTWAARRIAYTATVGHLSALDREPGARGVDLLRRLHGRRRPPATRPVTFFFNGGPGSASVWLHLGSFAPRRLVTGVPATTQAVPFPYVDNADSLIDTSDLVFVDAVGTGLSEAIAPHTNQTFWGVDADAAVLRDFVQRWLTVNGRAASPLFLFGESYGTTRVPVLTRLLETAGRRVNGVVELSSIVDYNSNCSVTGGKPTVSCAGFLPSYAAVGDYYQLATGGSGNVDADMATRAQLRRHHLRPRRRRLAGQRHAAAGGPRRARWWRSPACPPRSGTGSSTWTTTPSATT